MRGSWYPGDLAIFPTLKKNFRVNFDCCQQYVSYLCVTRSQQRMFSQVFLLRCSSSQWKECSTPHILQVRSFSQNPPHFYLLGHPNVLHVILFCWFLMRLHLSDTVWVVTRPFCSVTDLPVEEDKWKKIFCLLDHKPIEILLSLSKEQSKPLSRGLCEAHCDCSHKFIDIQRLG